MPRVCGIRAALWACGASLAASTCLTQGGRCLCEDESGTTWDLTELAGEEPHTFDGPAAATTDWDYSIKFCENIVPVATPCTSSGISEARAYRVSQSTGLQTCQQLGPGAEITSGMTPTSLAAGLSLRYLWLQRGITINLICDEGLQGQVTTPDRAVGTELPTVEWRTFVVCPANQGFGLSLGAAILIFLSVGGGVYICGGVGYNHSKGHSGVDNLVPQYDLWSQIPGLMSDGLYFTRVHLSEKVGLCACVAPGNFTRNSIYNRNSTFCLWNFPLISSIFG